MTVARHCPRVISAGGGVSLRVDDHHLPAGFVGFHDAVRFANFLEAKDARRFRLETS